MNNTEHPKHEPIEEGIEEEISDLPEMNYSRSNWSSRAAHTLLGWQRSVSRRSWRIAGGLATLCLGVLALLVILSSLRVISPPSSAAHMTQPIFLPRHAVNYPRYTYRTQPSAIYRGHVGPALNVAWSPDGTLVASGGRDSSVQVWNTQNGKRLLVYQGHSNEVLGIAWSPDGSRIASSGDDGTVQVWDGASGSHLLTLLTEADGVVWSPDGTQLASSGLDGMV